MKLRLAEGPAFWVTRITNVRGRVEDGTKFEVAYFGTYDVAVIFSTVLGYGDATMIELAFRKTSYTKEQVLHWFATYDLRHYDIQESCSNKVPPLADVAHISDEEVLVIAHKRHWSEKTLRTLGEYMDDQSFYLPKGIEPQDRSFSQDDIASVVDTLGLTL